MEFDLGHVGATLIGGISNGTHWIWNQSGGLINTSFWGGPIPSENTFMNRILFMNSGTESSPATPEASLWATDGTQIMTYICEIFP